MWRCSWQVSLRRLLPPLSLQLQMATVKTTQLKLLQQLRMVLRAAVVVPAALTRYLQCPVCLQQRCRACL